MIAFVRRWRKYYAMQRGLGEGFLVAFIHSLDDAIWITRIRRWNRERSDD